MNIQRKQTELSQLIVSQQARSLLPAHRPPTFDGDPLRYPAFITAFETLIESKVFDPNERMYFLEQYTSGKAKELISGCIQSKSEESYFEAKALLKKHYGDPFKIANAHTTKLCHWPSIKPNDGMALHDFAMAMEQAKCAMKGMSHMNDLNTAHVLRQLWEKLPRYLRSKWTETNNKTKAVKGRMANFEEFVEFVRVQADLATDPVFSEGSVSRQATEERDKIFTQPRFVRRTPTRSKGTSFVTDVSKTTKVNQHITTCVLCEGSHNVNDCEQFLKKPLTDRRDFVKDKKLCFSCFSDKHISKNCTEKMTCKVCSKQHPTSLHDDEWSKKRKNKSRSENNAKVNNNRASVSNMTENRDIPVNMGILPVLLYHKDNPTKKVKVYALLDNGSGGTFVTESAVRKLEIEGCDTNLTLTTMHGSQNLSTKAVEGLIAVNLNDESVCVDLPRTFTQKMIPADRSEIPRQDVVSKIPHLHDVSSKIHPYMEDVEVGLLVGLNCPSALRPREIIYGSESDPYAVRSLLGWYINGPAHSSIENSQSNNVRSNRIDISEQYTSTPARGYVVQQRTVKENITPQAVSQMFELDFSETERGTAMSREDVKFFRTVEEGLVHLEDSHYEMPLPLKNQNIELPNNYSQAQSRLESLKKRLQSDCKYRNDYCNFMTEIIDKGYARKVDKSDKNSKGRVWYLPHHGVYHPQKHKVRVVFDCSAKYGGQSLNDNLLQGPDLTSKLIGVLTRFRQEKFAFMADIEKMFFQVRVKKEDQSLLRFLWWPDGNIEREPEEYCMTVHLFGATSSPACANFALRRSADENEQEHSCTVTNTLKKNFYVDDLLKSTQTEDEAIELAGKVKDVCASGGFKLTKFIGNTERIIESIPADDRAENVKNITLGQDKLPIERALGVHWCIESDAFKFRIELKDNPCTRRGILSTISSIYDSLGFIAPVTLVGKKILQDIAYSGSWDDPIDDATKHRWEKWRNELPLLESLDVPRSFKPEEFGTVVSKQLHSMSDASTVGYGQCTYLRLKDDQGKVHTSFVMGKARVTPKRSVSIPRLELAAATVSVKVADVIKEELEYEDVEDHYWTDSKVVLGYISNESRRFHTYVANRVQLIQDHTTTPQWHYVETKSNPADEASRGMSAKDFVEKSKWLKGPAFLSQEDDEWLDKESYEDNVDPDSPEVKKVRVNATKVKEEYSSILERLERFSSFHRAKVAVAVCLKYKKRLKERAKARQSSQKPATLKAQESTSSVESILTEITVEDLEAAETEIIKQVQCAAFSPELKCLQDIQSKPTYGSRESDKERKTALKKASPLHTLDPYLDEKGILRVGGRIRRASMSESLKNPIILPSQVTLHC